MNVLCIGRIGASLMRVVMRASLVFRFFVWLSASPAASTVSFCVSAATPEVIQLIETFQAESVFKQREIANEIAKVATLADLSSMEPWLSHKDRRVRGNAAYLVALLGDQRGLATIEGILADSSPDRHVEWQGGSVFLFTDNAQDAMEKVLRSPAALRAQIVTDRYYAVHLLGRLRDRRAVEVLIPLLDDNDINYNVAWALGEIGDARAVPGLIAALSNSDALVRVSAIGALEQLRADQALPNLVALFGDAALPSAGDQVPVGVTARKAADVIRGTAAQR